MVTPQNTDWEKEIHRTALMQTYSVGLSKGDEYGTSSMSLSWLDHDGIIKGSDFQKANARFSSDYGFINNRLRAGGNVTVNWWRQHNAPVESRKMPSMIHYYYASCRNGANCMSLYDMSSSAMLTDMA